MDAFLPIAARRPDFSQRFRACLHLFHDITLFRMNTKTFICGPPIENGQYAAARLHGHSVFIFRLAVQLPSGAGSLASITGLCMNIFFISDSIHVRAGNAHKRAQMRFIIVNGVADPANEHQLTRQVSLNENHYQQYSRQKNIRL
ncbi:hypothetical protein [Saccharibacillus endophyticus]|uniref:hypothetical protein n=1 Tax=Saccharibacillus endophyticus TaxID=2060666 RepID=UPI001552ABB3|nr:hypothetical protein [Saccharibacillus endophyticus]